DRRLGPFHRADHLPDPRAQALAGVPGLPQAAARPLARPEAVCDRGQLLPAQTPEGHRLGRREQRGAGIPAHLLILAELDRSSAPGPVTRPTLHDEALAAQATSVPFRAS